MQCSYIRTYKSRLSKGIQILDKSIYFWDVKSFATAIFRPRRASPSLSNKKCWSVLAAANCNVRSSYLPDEIHLPPNLRRLVYSGFMRGYEVRLWRIFIFRNSERFVPSSLENKRFENMIDMTESSSADKLCNFSA